MLRTWDLNIQILRDASLSIHAQIVRVIIQDIKSGRLVAGTALPGSRALANKIQVNRKTVIQAYDDLVSKGWLNTEHKRGTFVAYRHHGFKQGLPLLDINRPSNTFTLREKSDNPINNTQIIFSTGKPDERLTPFEMLSRTMRHAFIASSRQQVQTEGVSLGLLELRKALLVMLNLERGLHTKLEQICTVRSTQLAIYLVAKSLIQSGDHVIVEQLSNPNAREAFKRCGAQIINVTHDDEGINVAHIEQLCLAKETLKLNIRAVYVMPNHQIPTTAQMSLPRRKKLVELAERYDFKIIEDDEGFLYHFNTQPLPPIASLKNNHVVIYLGSLSKAVSASVSSSFIIAEQKLVSQCAEYLSILDEPSNIVTELAVSELLQSGQMKKHLIHTHKIYDARRVYLIKQIEKELGYFVSISPSYAGLAFWLNVSAQINMAQLMQDLAALNIKIQAGELYSYSQNPVQGLVMGFANLTSEEAKLAIQKIKKAFLMQQHKQLSA